MKYQAITGSVVIIGCLFSLTALASTAGDGENKSRFMSFFDTNDDNVVTLDEFKAAAAKRFDNMDMDHNGSVDAEEFQNYLSNKSQHLRELRFGEIDSNADNQISQQEYLDYKHKKAERRFQTLDSNKDGVVSSEEFSMSMRGHHGKKSWHGCDQSGKNRIFSRLDSNSDGKITIEESLAAWSKWFTRIDANNDQVVTGDEVAAYRKNGKHLVK